MLMWFSTIVSFFIDMILQILSSSHRMLIFLMFLMFSFGISERVGVQKVHVYLWVAEWISWRLHRWFIRGNFFIVGGQKSWPATSNLEVPKRVGYSDLELVAPAVPRGLKPWHRGLFGFGSSLIVQSPWPPRDLQISFLWKMWVIFCEPYQLH